MTASPAPALPLASGKRIDDLATLAKNPLLAQLNLRELGVVVDLLDQVAIPSGTMVVREGENADYAFFVLEGEAKAHHGTLDLRPLRPGDHFGELSLLGVRHRASSVEATSTLRLARLSRARFLSLATNHPTLAIHLLQALGASLGSELASVMDGMGLLLRQRSVTRRTQVRIRRPTGVEVVAMGAAIGTLLPAPAPRDVTTARNAMIVAGLLDAKPVSLDTPVMSDAAIGALTLDSWEGREIYRRSVALLLLEAAHRVAPESDVRLGASIGVAQVVQATSAERDALARRLTRAMKTISAERAPFREELWTVEEARSMFAERGWDDASSLLRTWRDPTVTLVSCGDVYAIRNGPLLPRTDMIEDVSVAEHASGLLLDFGPLGHDPAIAGSDAREAIAREGRTPRFGGTMEQQHRHWLEALGITSVGKFNETCISGQVSQLVRISEGFHEKHIGQIADAITSKRTVRLIAIAGPSSSGKTTFIKRLSVQLEVEGIRAVSLSLDDYYRDRASIVAGADGEVDLEAMDALDVARFRSHVERALCGEPVKTARFDFKSGRSQPEAGPELTLAPTDILLVEGIHGLNPALFGGTVKDESLFRVFVHCGTALPFDHLSSVSREDLRLLRRIVRDRHQRGYTAAQNIAQWPSVRRGEEAHIYPHLAEADVVFDASLVYEMAVLKVFAERYLLEVPEDHPSYSTAYRLRHLVDRFVAIYPDHVPPTSVLRELIGGSGFEY